CDRPRRPSLTNPPALRARRTRRRAPRESPFLSFLRLQVRDQREDLVVAQLEVGHVAAGLEIVGIVQPGSKVFRRVLERAGRQRPAAGDMREVWAYTAQVAVGADAFEVNLRAELLIRLDGLGRSRRLLLYPGIKLLGRVRDHHNAHPCMLVAAELGARAEVGAAVVGLDPQAIRMARYDVDLAPQCGHPEIVDYVGRAKIDQQPFSDRDMYLIGGDHAGLEVVN